MKMGIKPDKNMRSPHIQILQRRTCSDGKAEYKIKRINENNKIAWEPIKNLKEFMKQITDFDKSYEDRVKNWTQESHKNNKSQNRQYFSSSMIDEAQERHRDHQNSIYKQKQYKQHNYKNQIWKSSIQREQNQTLDKSQKGLDKARNKQLLELLSTNPNQSTFRQNEKIRDQRIRQQQIQQQNKRIVCLLRRPIITTQITSKRVKSRKKSEKVIQRVTQIKDIYCIDKIWYARVVKGQKEVQILRDELRIICPLLLLSYYQKLSIIKGQQAKKNS